MRTSSNVITVAFLDKVTSL